MKNKKIQILKEIQTTFKHKPSYFTPKTLGNNSLDEFEAISELVANSFDWCITKRDKKQSSIIQIRIDSKYISILDNGIGMTSEQLDEANSKSQEIQDVVSDYVNCSNGN